MTLKIKHLCFAYGPSQMVLEDIAFTTPPGTLVAILGTNGSGKSTLLKNINRILKPQGGTVAVNGIEVASMSRKEVARQMGYMPQKSAGVQCTVFEAVLLGRKARFRWEVSRDDILAVERILKLIKLDGLAMRQTTELSGGELQKVIIARALAQEPRVLLLDEPINHLDLINQLDVMRLLQTLTRELQLISLVVTHDLNSALRFAGRFLFLRGGHLFAYGDRTIVTPATIKAVFNLDVVIETVAGIPVIVPISQDLETPSPGHDHT
ncbi:MAG: ABC transporter ATP-binding protein [Deltaproteobacteria bacterium]|nr:ABC transporter ATP-binding protein [Candidatus Anaeroferrophillus wilburensis]MBN2887772.1 ABC transporter ATP-binding protein [Deltaproteobacteria bacterium]